ncbi:hypothetical protein B0H34DRAFT_144086 [Crassisporium funariophilum]|nr:hypothetical protein B0H34DRAFT_144086 [Crassisporium funariophilum]
MFSYHGSRRGRKENLALSKQRMTQKAIPKMSQMASHCMTRGKCPASSRPEDTNHPDALAAKHRPSTQVIQPLAERMASNLASIAENPSTTRIFAPSRLGVVATQVATQTTTSSSSQSSSRSVDQIARVHTFLSSCVPPMNHFLQSFIDFGCADEEFLLGVSLWSPKKIEEFLMRLPLAPHGRPMSQMERLVLENHFSTYFKA